MAQIELTVGELDSNVTAVLRWSAQAAAEGAHLVVFPEMTLTGYPPEDLVFRHSFQAASQQALQSLAQNLHSSGLGELAVIVGYLDCDRGDVGSGGLNSDGVSPGGMARNASALCLGGQVVARYYKHHLPNYGVFDERRYFRPGTELPVIRLHGLDVAMTICEDMWQEGGPFATAADVGVDLMVNINGSPYERDKDDVRLPLARRRAAQTRAAIVYVNQVGGQDELVFDGDSFIVDAAGEVLVRAPQYVEGLYVTDISFADSPSDESQLPQTAPSTTSPPMRLQRISTQTSAITQLAPRPTTRQPVVAPRLSDEAEVWGALVLGTHDYVFKNGFSSVVLGLSGGIDSAVVAAIAADAIGGENVYGVSMPSSYSSDHSRTDASDLAARIGAHYQVVPIATMVDAFVDAVGLSGVAEENVQARVRGTTLMGLSNMYGHLVLATGNKSELAVGYSTIYGDAVGGFAPIKDVPKSLVWALARWRNAQSLTRGEQPPIPPNSIQKPPSAELRPGQLDSDSLPDYEVLDQILSLYVDGDVAVPDIIMRGIDPELVTRVARLVDAAEWKRRQYPLGPKIGFKAFGRDRRLPVTNRWKEKM